MLKLTIQNLDKLHDLVYELKIISYLQQLVQSEGNNENSYSAMIYLDDCSEEIIKKLFQLVFEENFTL